MGGGGVARVPCSPAPDMPPGRMSSLLVGGDGVQAPHTPFPVQAPSYGASNALAAYSPTRDSGMYRPSIANAARMPPSRAALTIDSAKAAASSSRIFLV